MLGVEEIWEDTAAYFREGRSIKGISRGPGRVARAGVRLRAQDAAASEARTIDADEDFRALGCEGGYEAVRRHALCWEKDREEASPALNHDLRKSDQHSSCAAMSADL